MARLYGLQQPSIYIIHPYFGVFPFPISVGESHIDNVVGRVGIEGEEVVVVGGDAIVNGDIHGGFGFARTVGDGDRVGGRLFGRDGDGGCGCTCAPEVSPLWVVCHRKGGAFT